MSVDVTQICEQMQSLVDETKTHYYELWNQVFAEPTNQTSDEDFKNIKTVYKAYHESQKYCLLLTQNNKIVASTSKPEEEAPITPDEESTRKPEEAPIMPEEEPATANSKPTANDKDRQEQELSLIINNDKLTDDELTKMRNYLIMFAKTRYVNNKGNITDEKYRNILFKYKAYTTKNKRTLKNIDGVSSNIESYPRGGEPSEDILLKRFSRMKGGTRKNRRRSSKRSTHRSKRTTS